MRLISIFFLVLVLFSCKKDEPEPQLEETLQSGVAVLCEGLFQQNNSSMSWVNFSTNAVTNSLFVAKTNRQLGDTGNDIQRYGGKVYIVVNISSTIEVMDASTFTSIKQIEMIDAGTAKQPRSIAFSGSNAYVTCFDGYVDVIDTASLTVVQRIPVGSNPEGLTVSTNKLYVSNSGGLNAPVMDSTVSVIDLATHTETQKIVVGKNPGGMITDLDGDVYVITRGDYGALPSRMVRIDAQNDAVVEQFSFDVSGVSAMNDKFLVTYYDYNSGQSSVGLFDPSTETLENPSYLDMSTVTTAYGVQYNPFRNRIYLMDAMNFTNTGYVREFDVSGNYIQSFHVGLNPSKAIFYE
jgi:YVTN family beta-propeller protein